MFLGIGELDIMFEVLFIRELSYACFFFFLCGFNLESNIGKMFAYFFYLCSLFVLVLIVTKSQMEREELYDTPNNLGPSEQELLLEDFGDCELKSKPYVGMQFDSFDDVETFYKEFAKKEGFGIYIRTSKKAPRSDNVTSRDKKCIR